MRILEIAPLENGAHRNQTYHGVLPPGWAVVPDDLETECFPFGSVEAAEIDGIMTVTAWTPGTIPEPEPMQEPEPTELEQLRADVDYILMMMEA